MNYKRVILFTSCVDPNGMTKTVVVDKGQREEEYKRALQYYLDNTSFPIVVVDNSGYSYEAFWMAYPERIEALSFHGNDFDRGLGKGYGEGLIIRYAMGYSEFIREKGCKFIYKVSGRHILTNLPQLSSIMCVAEVFSKKTAFAILREKEKWAISDFFSGPPSFFRYLTPYLDKCNDSKKKYFEHQLFRGIVDASKEHRIRFIHLPVPLEQEGVSGSTGESLQTYGKASRYIFKSILYVLHLTPLLSFYNKRIR